jgi:hypothetical protein
MSAAMRSEIGGAAHRLSRGAWLAVASSVTAFGALCAACLSTSASGANAGAAETLATERDASCPSTDAGMFPCGDEGAACNLATQFSWHVVRDEPEGTSATTRFATCGNAPNPCVLHAIRATKSCGVSARAATTRRSRERIVLVDAGSGAPFEHGLFELVEEDWPADELARARAVAAGDEHWLLTAES